MHEPNDMIRLLARLNLHFPRSGARTAAELAVLAEDLAADLAPWPFEVVERAFVCARRECEFWPSTARLRELCGRIAAEIERQRQRETPALEMTDEANIERGRRWCAVIVERLRRQGFEGRVRSSCRTSRDIRDFRGERELRAGDSSQRVPRDPGVARATSHSGPAAPTPPAARAARVPHVARVPQSRLDSCATPPAARATSSPRGDA